MMGWPQSQCCPVTHSEDAPQDPNQVKLLEALLEEAGLHNPSMQGVAAR